MDELFDDRRILSMSYLMVGLIALLLASRSPARLRPQPAFLSWLMCAAIAYRSYHYVDDMTVFRKLA